MKLPDHLNFPNPLSCPCPHCGEKIDAASGSRPVRTGDATLCAFCLKVSVFADTLTLRLPTPEEQKAFDADPALRQFKEIVRQAKLRVRAANQ